MWVQSLGWKDPLEEGMATHSSILAWRIPWTEEPGGLQFMGLQSPTRLSPVKSAGTPQRGSPSGLSCATCGLRHVSLALSTCVGSVPVRASKLSVGPLRRTLTELA